MARKTADIGTVRTWANGSSYKEVAEGKWTKVPTPGAAEKGTPQTGSGGSHPAAVARAPAAAHAPTDKASTSARVAAAVAAAKKQKKADVSQERTKEKEAQKAWEAKGKAATSYLIEKPGGAKPAPAANPEASHRLAAIAAAKKDFERDRSSRGLPPLPERPKESDAIRGRRRGATS